MTGKKKPLEFPKLKKKKNKGRWLENVRKNIRSD